MDTKKILVILKSFTNSQLKFLKISEMLKLSKSLFSSSGIIYKGFVSKESFHSPTQSIEKIFLKDFA